MAENTAQPIDEFSIAHSGRIFNVTGSGFRLSRRWLREPLSKDIPNFGTSIHGRVMGDEVCVIGTSQRSKEFHVTISADQGGAAAWDEYKKIELVVDVINDPKRLHARALQHECFDKTPPNAALFRQGSHWILECEIPKIVLARFSEDLVARSVDTVEISIEWPFAFAEIGFGSWGIYDGGTLRGYVYNLTWLTQANLRQA